MVTALHSSSLLTVSNSFLSWEREASPIISQGTGWRVLETLLRDTSVGSSDTQSL